MNRPVEWTLLAVLCIGPTAVAAEESPLPEAWDYAGAMQAVARRGGGRPGVVLHVGDSITHANPYGQWARSGAGRSDDDRAALGWMHAGADDDTDGWWLARADHPDGGRSYTACGGIRADEMLAGGKNGMPSLGALIETYRPQVVVLMLGTMFAPIVDRDVEDRGFTHQRGDVVRISSRDLGTLINYVEESERCDRWEFGIGSLMRNLAARSLL